MSVLGRACRGGGRVVGGVWRAGLLDQTGSFRKETLMSCRCAQTVDQVLIRDVSCEVDKFVRGIERLWPVVRVWWGSTVWSGGVWRAFWTKPVPSARKH